MTRARWLSIVVGTALVAWVVLVGAGSADASPGRAPSTAGVPVEEAPLTDQVAEGRRIFSAELSVEQGLGPLFNAPACVSCHSSPTVGGMGPNGLGTALRVGQLTDGHFDSLEGRGGPIARAHSIASLGLRCDVAAGIPAGANVTSVRNAPPLYGNGLIDAISDETILAGAVDRGNGVHGRPHLVRGDDGTTRVGRFGWKADVPTLHEFVGEAFRNEHGITNPVAPGDYTPAATGRENACSGEQQRLDDDGTMVAAVTAFLASLEPPTPAGVPAEAEGERVFAATGCADCHTPSLEAGGTTARLYSDLLLHDVGAALDDGVTQGEARGRDWRTTPLWGLRDRARFLHDGRARTIPAAIQAHGGEAEQSVREYRALSPAAREALLIFLGSL